MLGMRRVVYVGLRRRPPCQQHAVLTGAPWPSAARAFSAATPLDPKGPSAELAGSVPQPRPACAQSVGKTPATDGSKAIGSEVPAPHGIEVLALGDSEAPAAAASQSGTPSAHATLTRAAKTPSGDGTPGTPTRGVPTEQQQQQQQQQPASIRGPRLWAAAAALITAGISFIELHFNVFRTWQEQKKVETDIVNSTIIAQPLPAYVERSNYYEEWQRVFGKDDGFAILVHGNHMVGKSAIISRMLQKKQGVVFVQFFDNDDKTNSCVMKVLGADSQKQLRVGFEGAAARLGEKPIVVVDVPRGITNPDVMREVSNFAKNWGFELGLVRVIVVASTAAAALGFNPDGRFHSIFVAPLTKEEFDQPQVTRFVEHHGGKEGVDHKWDLYHVTGGNLGQMKKLLLHMKDVGWDQAQSIRLEQQKTDIGTYLGIDNQGGFGPKEERAAADLAKAVARAPFEQGVSVHQFLHRFTPNHFAIAIRSQGAFPLYYNAKHGRYYAVAPSVHQLLRERFPEPEVQAPRSWWPF